MSRFELEETDEPHRAKSFILQKVYFSQGLSKVKTQLKGDASRLVLRYPVARMKFVPTHSERKPLLSGPQMTSHVFKRWVVCRSVCMRYVCVHLGCTHVLAACTHVCTHMEARSDYHVSSSLVLILTF